MNAADVEAVIVAQAALIAALDAGDVAAIERATATLADLLGTLKQQNLVAPMDRTRVDHALRQSDAARIRVNFLADRTRQRRERLAQVRGARAATLYSPRGQMTG